MFVWGVAFRTMFQHIPANSPKCSIAPVFGASANLPEIVFLGVGFGRKMHQTINTTTP